jgi:amidohydrolase
VRRDRNRGRQDRRRWPYSWTKAEKRQGHWLTGGHGRLADGRIDGCSLGVKNSGENARLWSRRPHRHAARRCTRVARTRQFDGAAAVVFQPAEEGGGGGKAMVDDGSMSRFGIDEIYAMHTEPGLAIGEFATASGPIGASADGFRVHIEGKEAHGASPHVSIDPLFVGANIVLALQTIVSRNVHPRKCAVVTVGTFNGGKAGNVIPQSAELGGTTRTFDPAVRDLIETRVVAIAEKVAEAYGAIATVAYRRMYPPTVNHVRETLFAVSVARALVGETNVKAELEPLMGSEDFAFMLEERPGNIMLIGNGDTPSAHDPRYDFNDAAIPYGIAYFKSLIESGMSLQGLSGRSAF